MYSSVNLTNVHSHDSITTIKIQYISITPQNCPMMIHGQGQALAILCNNRCIFYIYTFAFSKASHISHLWNVAFWVKFLSSIMMQLATRPVRLGQSEKESGRIWNWRGSGATSHRNLGGHNKSFEFTTGVMRSQWKFLSSWAIWSEYLKNNFGQPV